MALSKWQKFLITVLSLELHRGLSTMDCGQWTVDYLLLTSLPRSWIFAFNP